MSLSVIVLDIPGRLAGTPESLATAQASAPSVYSAIHLCVAICASFSAFVPLKVAIDSLAKNVVASASDTSHNLMACLSPF